jgi:glutamine cyclotransferase
MLRNLTFLIALSAAAGAAAPHYGYRVVHTYPHDPQAFTQGLEYRNGFLYEGTGLNGRSSIRREELATGKVLQSEPLAEQYFGEGITLLEGRLLELTWKANVGFLYEAGTFKLNKSFYYPGEGWGLTNDGTQIYMSDGSAQIRVWDPKTLAEKRRINVHDGTKAIDQLNELEWVRGEIYANVWQTDEIARIDPADGHVIAWIDMAGILAPEERQHADVLNGIAYDAAAGRLFVTGKLWPKLFQIELVRKP